MNLPTLLFRINLSASFISFYLLSLPSVLSKSFLTLLQTFLRLLCGCHAARYRIGDISSFRTDFRNLTIALVGTSGLEPPTSRLSGVCSNQLSYVPIVKI